MRQPHCCRSRTGSESGEREGTAVTGRRRQGWGRRARGGGGCASPQTTSPHFRAHRYDEVVLDCLPGASPNLCGHPGPGGFGSYALAPRLPAEKLFRDQTSDCIGGPVTGLPQGHSQAAEGSPRLSRRTWDLGCSGGLDLSLPGPLKVRPCVSRTWGHSPGTEKWEPPRTQTALAVGTGAPGWQVVAWRGAGRGSGA